MNKDEQELIAHIVDGDKDAYRVLVDRYKDGVYRHCFYIIHDEDAAEDVAQMAFIRGYTHLRKYNARKASFKTWLYTIASRLCLDHLRRVQVLPLADEDYVLSTYATPEQLSQNREVYEAVLRLQPRYRAVITLHYWHGYSYEQIADTMHAPIGSVRGWLHRAKKELKEVLS